ncbi:hypothetical protein [Micromonospora aurantiaca]|uniref:hypothetical protein n=1 Tax=Micromonospora aurantiaca (nom. illeg.) TaxID=47850 RepID=UPI0038026A79
MFAPAAAVGTIAAAIGNRIRRTAELLGGVIVGVLVGDLIIKLIGAGPVQTGLVVALAISLAVAATGAVAPLRERRRPSGAGVHEQPQHGAPGGGVAGGRGAGSGGPAGRG